MDASMETKSPNTTKWCEVVLMCFRKWYYTSFII